MLNLMKKCMIAIVFAACFVLSGEQVFIISDSTAVDYRNMANPYSPGRGWSPMAGWGECADNEVKDGVEFVNRAAGGYSSKLYVNRRLEKTAAFFKKDGWLLLSFGCNDARPSPREDRATDARTTFTEYMGIITDSAEKAGMKIVVISPMPSFEMVNGKFSHPLLAPYAKASEKFAAEKGFYFIDLYTLLTKYFEKMPESEIKTHYMFIKRGEHPNWPQGRYDNLHLTQKGAAVVWKLIRQEIDRNIPELAKLFK